ncbi:hypothetical protein GGR56DRAFT_97805 [Xylariaceae sp. FL0804]|nr:hypothetical protein GGR56DRAFT_97805 [Xylariaceae sp. FL0804]
MKDQLAAPRCPSRDSYVFPVLSSSESPTCCCTSSSLPWKEVDWGGGTPRLDSSFELLRLPFSLNSSWPPHFLPIDATLLAWAGDGTILCSDIGSRFLPFSREPDAQGSLGIEHLYGVLGLSPRTRTGASVYPDTVSGDLSLTLSSRAAPTQNSPCSPCPVFGSSLDISPSGREGRYHITLGLAVSGRLAASNPTIAGLLRGSSNLLYSISSDAK